MKILELVDAKIDEFEKGREAEENLRQARLQLYKELVNRASAEKVALHFFGPEGGSSPFLSILSNGAARAGGDDIKSEEMEGLASREGNVISQAITRLLGNEEIKVVVS